MQPGNNQLIGLIIGLVIVVPILLLRNARPRALKIERLWIRPAIFIVLMGAALFAAAPPVDPLNIAVLAVALLIGCGLGWLRGRSMRIEVHPETHDLTARASPLGIVFILALFLIRFGLRGVAYQSAGATHLSFITIADAFVLLAVGMMVVQGIEMWLRARRLLAEAAAAKAAGGAPAPVIVS